MHKSDVSLASQGLRLLVVEGADTAAKAGHRRLLRNDLKSGALFKGIICFAGCSWQNAGAAGCLVFCKILRSDQCSDDSSRAKRFKSRHSGLYSTHSSVEMLRCLQCAFPGCDALSLAADI